MNNKELAVSLGLARAHRNGSPLPTVSHSQTWSLSQEANKKCGTCRVCFATRQLHMKDGTVHKHGPRNKPCSGSHQPPLSDSVQIRQSTSATATAAAGSASPEDTTRAPQLSPVSASSATAIGHPLCNNSSLLKRIPKGARPAAANLLLKLIRDVLQHPLLTSSWSKLLGFSSACLAKPSRGGKSRNLTTQTVKQIFQYEHGVV